MATLTVQDIPATGLVPTTVAASGTGDEARTDTDVLLYVENDDAVSHTVTLTTPRTVRGVALADPAVVVAAGSVALIPLLPDLYRNPATGRASWTYDAVTSLKVAAVRVPR